MKTFSQIFFKNLNRKSPAEHQFLRSAKLKKANFNTRYAQEVDKKCLFYEIVFIPELKLDFSKM